jgi:glycosyltransferase involved in cell wall biosynthesis
MRILYISFNMPWRGGGTFYRVMGFARHLANRGHEVTVLATSPGHRRRFEERPVEGVRLALAPALLGGRLRTGWDPYEVGRRVGWLRNESFDLIHGFESRPVVIYPALAARDRFDAPLVLDWCDWFGRGGAVEERGPLTRAILRPVETYYEEHFRARADGTTVINMPLRERAIRLGVAPETIHWLPNGAETTRIQVIARDAARRALSLDPGGTYIGHLGQAFPGDAELMAGAFAALSAARPESRLILLGNHRTDIGAYFGDPGRLIDTGHVTAEEMNRYLAACDVLWLPLKNTLANRGRWPMKMNDYLSSGRATVSTPVGDLARFFDGDEPAGRLAADEPADFARQTLALLSDDSARQIYERNARHLAETVFDWQLVTAGLEAFYERVLAGRPR